MRENLTFAIFQIGLLIAYYITLYLLDKANKANAKWEQLTDQIMLSYVEALAQNDRLEIEARERCQHGSTRHSIAVCDCWNEYKIATEGGKRLNEASAS